MDILDILLDILLKPPQPFIGLFFPVPFILGLSSACGILPERTVFCSCEPSGSVLSGADG